VGDLDGQWSASLDAARRPYVIGLLRIIVHELETARFDDGKRVPLNEAERHVVTHGHLLRLGCCAPRNAE
jgi:hypothetical protein